MAQVFKMVDTAGSPASLASPGGALSHLLLDIYTLYRRTMIRMVRQPAQLIFSLAQPLAWFLFFGQLFSRLTTGFGVVGAGGQGQLSAQFGTTNYTAFFLPAIIVQVLLFGPVNSALGFINDDQTGYLTKLRVAPINRLSIMLGNLLADVTRMLIQVVIVLLLGFVAGVRPVHPELLPLLFVIATLFGLMMGGIWLFIGLTTRNMQATYLIFNFFSLPLLFASSAQLPLGLLPGWLQVVAQYNPVTYAVNALRVIFIGLNARQAAGHQTELSIIALSAGILTALLVLALTAGVWRFRKQMQ